jgi:hypothetical protein
MTRGYVLVDDEVDPFVDMNEDVRAALVDWA